MRKFRLSVLAAILVYSAIAFTPVQADMSCIPSGSPDDLGTVTDCCSGQAVKDTVTCYGHYPEDCVHTCA
jgi:hypothetical protein